MIAGRCFRRLRVLPESAKDQGVGAPVNTEDVGAAKAYLAHDAARFQMKEPGLALFHPIGQFD